MNWLKMLGAMVVTVFVAFVFWFIGAWFVIDANNKGFATFGTDWKCTQKDAFYTKDGLERYCKQWTRIK